MKSIANAIVKKHIDGWDPEFLLALGAPNDEYDPEIDYIVSVLQESKNERELAKAIQYIFERMFDTTYDLDECMQVASVIWKEVHI